jgi:hypothetical protein
VTPGRLDEALVQAAEAFLTKLDEVEKATAGSHLIAHVHGFRYDGPNYTAEKQAFRDALKVAESQRDTKRAGCCFCEDTEAKLIEARETIEALDRLCREHAEARQDALARLRAQPEEAQTAPVPTVKIGYCMGNPARPHYGVVEWQGCYTACIQCKGQLRYADVETVERVTGKTRPAWWTPEKVIGYRPQDVAARLRAAVPEPHKWITRRAGGSPVELGSYEQVRFCDTCGVEQTEDNANETCVPEPQEET